MTLSNVQDQCGGIDMAESAGESAMIPDDPSITSSSVTQCVNTSSFRRTMHPPRKPQRAPSRTWPTAKTPLCVLKWAEWLGHLKQAPQSTAYPFGWILSAHTRTPKFMDPNNRKQQHVQTIDVGIAIIDHPPNHHKWGVYINQQFDGWFMALLYPQTIDVL